MGTPKSKDAAKSIVWNYITVMNIFRLLDPIKAEIIKKSNQLSKDIRLYNSIVKYKDIPEPVDDPTPKKQAQSELLSHEPQPHSENERSPATEPANAQHSSQSSTLPPADKELSLRIEEEPEQRQESSECIRPEDVAVAVEKEEEQDAVRTEKQLDDDVRGFQIYYFQIIIRTCLIYLYLLLLNCANPVLTNRLSLLADLFTECCDVGL